MAAQQGGGQGAAARQEARLSLNRSRPLICQALVGGRGARRPRGAPSAHPGAPALGLSRAGVPASAQQGAVNTGHPARSLGSQCATRKGGDSTLLGKGHREGTKVNRAAGVWPEGLGSSLGRPSTSDPADGQAQVTLGQLLGEARAASSHLEGTQGPLTQEVGARGQSQAWEVGRVPETEPSGGQSLHQAGRRWGAWAPFGPINGGSNSEVRGGDGLLSSGPARVPPACSWSCHKLLPKTSYGENLPMKTNALAVSP